MTHEFLVIVSLGERVLHSLLQSFEGCPLNGFLYKYTLLLQSFDIMWTRPLVNSSYKCIQLMDFLCSVTALNVETGRLSRRDRFKAKVIHNTTLALLILKNRHLIYTLALLRIPYKPESFANTIFTLSWLSLLATSMYWVWLISHRDLPQTIMLFNSLSFSLAGDHTEISISHSLQDIWTTWLHANIGMLLTLNIQVLMCVMTL